jgi:hypothetical protein
LFQVRSLSGGARVSGGIGTWTCARTAHVLTGSAIGSVGVQQNVADLGENRQFRVLRLFDFSRPRSFLYGRTITTYATAVTRTKLIAADNTALRSTNCSPPNGILRSPYPSELQPPDLCQPSINSCEQN